MHLRPIVFVTGVSAFAQPTVHLSAKTNQAFDSYIQPIEARNTSNVTPKGKPGEIHISTSTDRTPVSVEDGLIHDWTASMEVPGATIEKVLALFQDYGNYSKTFAPEVVESKLLSRDGNVWHPRLRLRRKNVVTVVLDTDYDVEYKPMGQGKWAVLSRSTRISEVKDGEGLPPGTGAGYLWRLNAYWLLAPTPAGVYLECRSVSLSRDIPAALRWLIKPMVSGVPRDSLQRTLEAARRGLQ
jgi:hypothetical protein